MAAVHGRGAAKRGSAMAVSVAARSRTASGHAGVLAVLALAAVTAALVLTLAVGRTAEREVGSEHVGGEGASVASVRAVRTVRATVTAKGSMTKRTAEGEAAKGGVAGPSAEVSVRKAMVRHVRAFRAAKWETGPKASEATSERPLALEFRVGPALAVAATAAMAATARLVRVRRARRGVRVGLRVAGRAGQR